MKRLLRSCIDLDGSISPENLVANFQRLVLANLDWSRPDDAKVYEFLRLYFQQRLELPSLPTARDYFEKSGDIEVLERLKDIEATPFYIRTGFLHLLESIQEEQNKIRATALLKESHEIINKGVHFQEGREKVLKKGIRDALMHFQEKAHNLLVTGYNAKTTGDIRQDGQAVWDQYVDAKINKDKVWGRLTGLERIDTVCHGIKKGELWIHAAAPGELKSTLAVNVCYNLVTRYRTNVIYYSFEMTYEQLRLQVYTLHSAHARWRLEGYDKPLDYRRVRDGLLDDREEEFLRKVIEDFSTNPEYCHFEMRCPDRNFTVDDVRLDAELTHKQLDVGFIVLDHGMLMEARSTKRSHDYVVELNSIIRDTKKLCLQFNHGEKIPILMLFQINRQGKEEASKNQGRYKTSALAYSNECVVAGTLVKTARGLVPIEAVQVGDRVWSRSGWKPVLNTFDQGVRPTVRVTTEFGRSITVTPNHLLRVLSDGEVQWMRADALVAGEHFLLESFGAKGFPTEHPALPPLAFEKHEKPNGMKGVPLVTPTHLTEDLAYLMGAYEGDGVAGTDYKVGFTGNRLEQAVKSRIMTSFRETFGQPLGAATSPSRPGSFDLVKWSKALKRWFVSVGMNREPGVPEVIRQAPEACVRAYLRGLWDTDGSITNQNVVVLSQKATNRRTLEEVALLMADLGIETTLGQHTNTLRGQTYEGCFLRVRTQEGRMRFTRIIGFTEPEKQARLERAVSLRTSERMVWPVGRLFLEVYERYAQGRSKAMVGDRRFKFERPVGKAARALQKNPEAVVPSAAIRHLLSGLCGVADPQVETLTHLYQTVRPQRVAEVAPQAEQQVYDIEVTGDHEYVTGGLLSHNCEKSADFITTTFLDEEHRRNGTTIVCNLKNRDNPIIEPFLAKIDFPSKRIYNLDLYQGADGSGMSADDHAAVLEAMANL